MKCSCQLVPSQAAYDAPFVEGYVDFAQVPSEPAVDPCFRQPDVTHVDNRTSQEVLRCSAKPAQHE